MSDLTRRIAELSAEKRALLVKRMQARSTAPIPTEKERPAASGDSSGPSAQAVERHRALHEWSGSSAVEPEGLLTRIAERARREPQSEALLAPGVRVTWGELSRRAAAWALRLRQVGVEPEVRVALCARWSTDAVAAVLGALRAGGACIPLDPDIPADRLAEILADMQPAVVVAQNGFAGRLPEGTLWLDAAESGGAVGASGEPAWPEPLAEGLAWVCYGMGHGEPATMLSHRALAIRLAGLDEQFGSALVDTTVAEEGAAGGGWLSKVLWPLWHGAPEAVLPKHAVRAALGGGGGMAFSISFFSGDGSGQEEDKYRLVLESARFADRHDFAAVWLPERHFHRFGGLYPSPAIMASALAMVTERLQIRAGSVVLPLHHPARVAEEWAMVDNLSRGRVGVAFASGWHPDDFVYAPDSYARRREELGPSIAAVQRLWAGGTEPYRGGAGNELKVRTFPRPLRRRLPVWITSGGTPETFVKAGQVGAHVLTNLLGQSLEALAENIQLYRETLRQQGHDSEAGQVTLMLHTFLGEDPAAVRERVRSPFCRYLETFTGLLDGLARSLGLAVNRSVLTAADMENLLAHAFERYATDGALFGTPESCLEFVLRLRGIGVDEVACLLDFGLPPDEIIAGLEPLDRLRRLAAPATVRRLNRQVSVVQASPGTARQLMDAGAADLAEGVRVVLDRIPAETLVSELEWALRRARLFAFVGEGGECFSLLHDLRRKGGRPLAGLSAYVLDQRLDLVPTGSSGELWLAGPALARGFLGRPDLTADRFRPDPFDPAGGGRLLRTVLRARHLPDGTLELRTVPGEKAAERGAAPGELLERLSGEVEA